MIFLLFAVQILFGLYARTTVTAVASDMSRIAATTNGGNIGPDDFVKLEAQAQDRLGDYGDDAQFSFALIDSNSDGRDDTVTVTVHAALPTLLPARWIPGVSTDFSRTMRSRIEEFQADDPAVLAGD